MSSRTHLVVAACVLFAAVTATAQEPNSSATRAALRDAQLESLVAEALAKAPEMASAQASVEAAQRRTEPARTLADPFLSTSYQNDGRAISFGEAEGSFLGGCYPTGVAETFAGAGVVEADRPLDQADCLEEIESAEGDAFEGFYGLLEA